MSDPNTFVVRKEAIRNHTMDILDRLAAKTQSFELPAPPASLLDERRKLADNHYKVMVVGEAKRGKSTFINALMGCDLLPTAVDVATCQVFQVQRSEHEAYRLRYEDGSARAINADQLKTFGSQVEADAGQVPRLDQIIRCIEVEGSFTFLPEGICILDTPGLGALYAAHAQITQRFLPEADAVIFTLDSNQPIVQPELDFLEQVLAVTPNIFFIQTKIDMVRQEEWESVQQRNQQILAQRFGERLSDTRVWPIASTLLRKAADTGKESLLILSRHAELAAGLKSFLFHVAGWQRAAHALTLADQHYNGSRKTLSGRLASVQESSRQKRAELQQRQQGRKQEFESTWGQNGSKRADALAEVKKICMRGMQSFQETLNPGGSVETAMRVRIDALQNIKEVNALLPLVPTEIVGGVAEEWQSVRSLTEQQCSEQIGLLVEAGAALVQFESAEAGELSTSSTDTKFISSNWWNKFKGARNDYLVMSGVWTGATSCGLIMAFPVLPFVLSFATLWVVVKGLRAADTAEVENGKRQIHQQMQTTLLQVRKHFLSVELKSKHGSLVNEYFQGVEHSVTEHMQSIATQKAEEAGAEIKRLADAAQASESELQAQSRLALQQQSEWDALGKEIRAAVAELTALDTSFTGALAAARSAAAERAAQPA